MGIGMALHEDLLYDRRSGTAADGRLLRRSRPDASRRARDRSRSSSRATTATGPFGAKSMGESSKVPRRRRRRQRGLQRDRPPHEGSADHARQDPGGARMKTFTNANARDLQQAVDARPADARRTGSTAVVRRRRQRSARAW